METITKKTVLIEFEGKKYVLPDDITVGQFLSEQGIAENVPVKMMSTKDGFLLTIQE